VIQGLQKKEKKKRRKEAYFYNGTPGAWHAGNPSSYPVATEIPANMC